MNGNVFISYARNDTITVNAIIHHIERNGLAVWMDTKNMRWGDDVGDEIELAIIKSEYIVFCISKSFIDSNWCNKELGIAINSKKYGAIGKKTLLTLILDDSETYVKNHDKLSVLNYRKYNDDPKDVALALVKAGYNESDMSRRTWEQFKNKKPEYNDYLSLNSWLPYERRAEIANAIIELLPDLKVHRQTHWKSLSLANKKNGNVQGKNTPAWVRVSTTHSEKVDTAFRLCFGFKNTPCTYRGTDPLSIGCFNCGFYAGTDFKKANREEILSQVRYALSHGWSGRNQFDAIEILSDGSFLCDREVNDEIKAELFHYFSRMPYISRVLVESTPEHIWTETEEVPNLIGLLNESQTLEIGIGLETADDFIRKACINKGFSRYDFEEALSRLSDLPLHQKNRCRVVSYILIKPAFLSNQEYIEDVVHTMHYLARMERTYGVSIVPKLEPAAVANGTILSLLYSDPASKFHYAPLNYWSVLEILTRISEEHDLKDIFSRIRIGAREDMDEIIKVPAIYRESDGRYDQFDFILYDALQRFNQHHSLSRVFSTIQNTHPVNLRRHKLLSPLSSLGKWYKSHLYSNNTDRKQSGLLGVNSYINCSIERFFDTQKDLISEEMKKSDIKAEIEFLLATYKALDVIEGYSSTKSAKLLHSNIENVLIKYDFSINEYNKSELEEALSCCFESDLKLFQVKITSVTKVENENTGFVRIFFDAIDYLSGKTYPIWSECELNHKASLKQVGSEFENV